jgi:hypothetical protein
MGAWSASLRFSSCGVSSEACRDRASDRAARKAHAVDGDEGDVKNADAVGEPDEVAAGDGGEEAERDVS